MPALHISTSPGIALPQAKVRTESVECSRRRHGWRAQPSDHGRLIEVACETWRGDGPSALRPQHLTGHMPGRNERLISPLIRSQ